VPVEPSPSPTPTAPAAPAGLSAGAIRKRLAEARDLAGVGRSKIAREIYAELEKDPRARPQALLGLARLAQSEGDYAAAIRLSTDAAKAGVGAEALMVRGGAYLARHEPDRAKADFDRVLKLQPKNLDAAEGLKAAAQLKRDTP
jgi:tetratricopeptide (TPR) repeat protein